MTADARWTLSPKDWCTHALVDQADELPGFVRTRCGLVFAPVAPIETRPVMHGAMCSSCADWVFHAAVGPPVFDRGAWKTTHG